MLEKEGARNIVDDDDDYDDDYVDDVPVVLPGYFRMLTLMALRVFCCYRGDGEGKGEDDDDYDHRPRRIDAILMEVGMGGRYDATNVLEPGYEDRRIVVYRDVDDDVWRDDRNDYDYNDDDWWSEE